MSFFGLGTKAESATGGFSKPFEECAEIIFRY